VVIAGRAPVPASRQNGGEIYTALTDVPYRARTSFVVAACDRTERIVVATALHPLAPPVGRVARRHHLGWGTRGLAVLALGFVAGAAAVMLADPGTSATRVLVTPGATATAGAHDLNGHHIVGVKAGDVAAETQPDKPLDPATRALLAQQLMLARATAMKYPTVVDAERAGYRLVAGFGPGAGAHYIGGPMTGSGPFDASKAQSLLYDGTSPTSKIVGLMYFGMGATAPEGFAGPNDHWHRHSHVCTTFVNGKIDVPFAPDSDVTPAQCTQVGGRYMAITGWMVHAWVVPGWESPAGVFSHENPNLRCADGTFNTDKIGKCQGS
jgi:hypothetical protein